MTFQGKVALIVGGGRGIGAATAQLLAERGAQVVVNYRSNTAAAEDVIAAIERHGGQARAIQADILDAQSCARLVRETLVQLLEMVDNSTSLCKSPFGWFFRHWTVRTGHFTLE